MNIYLSGPVTNTDDAAARFDAAISRLIDVDPSGREYYTSMVGRIFDPTSVVPLDATHDLAMTICLNALTRRRTYGTTNAEVHVRPYYDVLCQLDGWEKSSGCQLEYAVARACGIRTMSLDELCSYYKKETMHHELPDLRLHH